MGLQQNMISEPVSRLALRTPALSGPNETVRATVKRMRKGKLGCVIVIDADRKPIGMFTESMLTQLLVHEPDAINDAVGEHMANQWPWVTLGDPIVDVLQAMTEKNIRFICVVDDQGRVAGLTGQKGLMGYVAEHFPGQVMVQRVGQGPYRHREGA